jgi:hypothetical protein
MQDGLRLMSNFVVFNRFLLHINKFIKGIKQTLIWKKHALARWYGL